MPIRKGNLYDPEYIKDGSIEEKTEYASLKVIEEFDKIKRSLRLLWLMELNTLTYKYENKQNTHIGHYFSE